MYKRDKTRQIRVCHICGNNTFISEYPEEPSKPGIIHTRIKCKFCGAWQGGITKKIKKIDK